MLPDGNNKRAILFVKIVLPFSVDVTMGRDSNVEVKGVCVDKHNRFLLRPIDLVQ